MPYRAQVNGQVEDMNRTLLSMLKTLPEKQKTTWKDSLNKLVHAYNCTKREATGYAPFYLMFGRTPRLPAGLIFDLDKNSETVDYPTYVSEWQRTKNSMTGKHTAWYHNMAIVSLFEIRRKEGDQRSFVQIGKNRCTSLRNEKQTVPSIG